MAKIRVILSIQYESLGQLVVAEFCDLAGISSVTKTIKFSLNLLGLLAASEPHPA